MRNGGGGGRWRRCLKVFRHKRGRLLFMCWVHAFLIRWQILFNSAAVYEVGQIFKFLLQVFSHAIVFFSAVFSSSFIALRDIYKIVIRRFCPFPQALHSDDVDHSSGIKHTFFLNSLIFVGIFLIDWMRRLPR